MSQNKPFYITTTLPYVNADPHVGFALEILQADALVRSHISNGREVFFSTGTDEHGQKIFEASVKSGQEVQEYVDHYANEFKKLKDILGLSNNLNFIRTTDEKHIKAAQEMWERCAKNGDIYQKEFEGLYCVGCERYLTEKDLENGVCSIHLKAPVPMKEKNWFFKLSNYQDRLLKYLENPNVIYPEWRREEALNFVREGLEDFSISREKEKLSWGIPVPGDDMQVMYVWFDALTNYISTLGWPEETGDFDKFWNNGETVQMAGKDQVRFQSIIWQAMLMSAGVKNTDQIFYHGFINSGGQKMSKSLGNVISPSDLVNRYGTEAVRYLLLRHVHSTEDTDITPERLDEWYTAGLVNGLGNLVARIMKLSETYLTEPVELLLGSSLKNDWAHEFDFQGELNSIWKEIANLDLNIQETKPWETKDIIAISELNINLIKIATRLEPFMPETAKKIIEAVRQNKKPENLFPRINA